MGVGCVAAVRETCKVCLDQRIESTEEMSLALLSQTYPKEWRESTLALELLANTRPRKKRDF